MSVQQQIDEQVKGSKIMLFMKGTPQFPQCGFSGQAVQLLQACEAEFGSFDVLSDDGVRQGIKEYSSWPTIPQLYVDGKFIGGCDIMIELHQNGELQKLVDSTH
jgi:monothiol glutaredoxin